MQSNANTQPSCPEPQRVCPIDLIKLGSVYQLSMDTNATVSEIKRAMDKREEERELRDSSRDEKQRLKEKEQDDKISALQNWRWYVIGIFSVVVFLVSKLM